MSYLSNQKLWKVVKEPTGYYYEIKLKGMVIDRIKVEYPALSVLKKEGVIEDERKDWGISKIVRSQFNFL